MDNEKLITKVEEVNVEETNEEKDLLFEELESFEVALLQGCSDVDY